MSKPVPKFMTIAGHRVMCEYRGMRRVCVRCGEGGHMATACSAEYCKRCGIFGHDTDGCEAECKMCGGQARHEGVLPQTLRDVRGPGQGRSTYDAKEQVKIIRHLKLTGAWLRVHNDLFAPTRISRTTASRLDRAYLLDYLLSSVAECEVLALPSTLAGKSDRLPLTLMMRGSPGPRNGNLGWRLDPSLLEDETCVERIRDRLRESLRNAFPMTPQVWDDLKPAWRTILQEEACTQDYLDSLEASYTRLLQLSPRRPARAHAQTANPTSLDLNEVCGNGGVQITEAKRPDGSVTTEPEEIASIIWNHFRTQFQASDFIGKRLLRYWCRTNTKFLDADRPLGPLAETPSTFYKAAAIKKRMLDTEVPDCDVNKDPPVRIVEELTRRQLTADEEKKSRSWRRKQTKLGGSLPKEVQDFTWKRNWEVVPTRERLHRFGVLPSARCPKCREDESANHALFECPAAEPIWRLTPLAPYTAVEPLSQEVPPNPLLSGDESLADGPADQAAIETSEPVDQAPIETSGPADQAAIASSSDEYASPAADDPEEPAPVNFIPQQIAGQIDEAPSALKPAAPVEKRPRRGLYVRHEGPGGRQPGTRECLVPGGGDDGAAGTKREPCDGGAVGAIPAHLESRRGSHH
ncbi:hypothetical protein MTO96_029543 [Rhipicephalus appendiculatus]